MEAKKVVMKINRSADAETSQRSFVQNPYVPPVSDVMGKDENGLFKPVKFEETKGFSESDDPVVRLKNAFAKIPSTEEVLSNVNDFQKLQKNYFDMVKGFSEFKQVVNKLKNSDENIEMDIRFDPEKDVKDQEDFEERLRCAFQEVLKARKISKRMNLKKNANRFLSKFSKIRMSIDEDRNLFANALSDVFLKINGLDNETMKDVFMDGASEAWRADRGERSDENLLEGFCGDKLPERMKAQLSEVCNCQRRKVSVKRS